jgi:hypothetical protein
MKKGKSIVALAEELERLQESKRDFVAPTQKLEVVLDKEGRPVLAGLTKGKGETMSIRHTAHRQIAQRLGIHGSYYDRMLEDAPDLLATNINHWFHKEPARRMFRTIEGGVRAVLSDRYRPLDNYELAEAALPTLQDKGAEVRSSEITDSRMYVQAVLPKMQAEPVQGDVVQAGVVISNSEIGLGSLRIEPMVFRLVCINGMIATEALRQMHVGRRAIGDTQFATELLSDETRRVDDAAFWMKARDLTKASFNKKFFDLQVGRIIDAEKVTVEGEIEDVVETTTKKFGLSEGERKGFLTNLIKDGGKTKWQFVNAITKLAHDSESYDRSIELERLGGTVMELPKREFAALTGAAKN